VRSDAALLAFRLVLLCRNAALPIDNAFRGNAMSAGILGGLVGPGASPIPHPLCGAAAIADGGNPPNPARCLPFHPSPPLRSKSPGR